MMTWRLWSALGKPPHSSPIFQYSAGRSRLRRRWLIVWLVLGFILTCFGTSFVWSSFLNFLFFGSPVILLLLPVIGSTVAGMGIAVSMGSALAHARENGLYAMLATVPVGLLKSVWALGVGHLYRMYLYRGLRFLLTFLFAAIFLAFLLEGTLLLLLSATQSTPKAQAASLDALVTVIWLLVTALVLGIEYVQSILVGAVTGLAISNSAADPLTAQLAAIGLFLALQLFTYLLVLTFWIVVLPPLMTALFPDHLALSAIVAALLRLLALYAVREAILVCLWRFFVTWLDTDAAEQHDFAAQLKHSTPEH